MEKDDFNRTLGELKEANRNIAESMNHIKDNLKILNDHNILHSEKNSQEHIKFFNLIETMTSKYWWLIISLMVVVLLVMGYKETVQLLIP